MSKKMKNNTGTTLVELMVYMIIGLIVITAVYKIITTATQTYVQGRAVSKGQFNARDVVNSMTKDIASMGYKSYTDYTDDNITNPDNIGIGFCAAGCKRVDTVFASTRVEEVVGDGRAGQPGNKAAFFFLNHNNGGANNNDELEFFRIRTADRNADERDVRVARERIRYSVSADGDLIREFWVWRGDADADREDWEPATDWVLTDETIILSDVAALDFRFSRTGMEDTPVVQQWFDDGTISRDQVRHVEVAILVRSHRQSSTARTVDYVMPSGRTISPDLIGNETRPRIHRLYVQAIEVPNNATGF